MFKAAWGPSVYLFSFSLNPHVQSRTRTLSSSTYLREDRWKLEDHLAEPLMTTGWKVKTVLEKQKITYLKRKKNVISLVLVQFECLAGFALRVCNLMVFGFIFLSLFFCFLTYLPSPPPLDTSYTLFSLGCISLIGAWFVVESFLSNVAPCSHLLFAMFFFFFSQNPFCWSSSLKYYLLPPLSLFVSFPPSNDEDRRDIEYECWVVQIDNE